MPAVDGALEQPSAAPSLLIRQPLPDVYAVPIKRNRIPNATHEHQEMK
jgi:hypothetical protein